MSDLLDKDMNMDRKDTHSNKAVSYNIGRPDYPESFFAYLYEDIVLSKESIIADVGAGTGKITKSFLDRGNFVYAIEPDRDMMVILKDNLSFYKNCIFIENTAEKTGVSTDTVDFIFCGNSYMWFNRKEVVPEFQRITRYSENDNILIARLGAENNIYSKELTEINEKYSNPGTGTQPNNSPSFINDLFVEVTFDYIYHQKYDEFLHGCLSASFASNPGDDFYNEYCMSLKRLFNMYNVDGLLAGCFSLYCIIGNVENLAHS